MTDTVAGPDPDPRAGSPSAPPAPPGDFEAPRPPGTDSPGDWSFSSSAGFGDDARAASAPRLTYDPGLSTTNPSSHSGRDLNSDPDLNSDGGFQPLSVPIDPPGRHPMDPDPAPSTKAAAVLALGVAALITGPLVGGLVPATLALLLARQARAELIAGRGYLTGARQLRLGVTLAWTGVGLAVAALVVATVFGILSLADVNVRDFPNTSN
jgi:hypothetical protein